MSEEYEKYQRIKEAILIVAWNEIESSNQASTDINTIKRRLKELFEKYEFKHQQIQKLLDEIVAEDKWLNYERGYNSKIVRVRFVMRSNGRKKIDDLFKTKAQVLIKWLKNQAPKIASYIDNTIIKPTVSAAIAASLRN